ncbi:MAG: glycosyltransferase family 2 protein [Lactobacillales bacterium]|jgi:glycosyltransferase involved in cell wall biosynthesis|nr:glycosyltransferase family 2 protein [Lactobacillales bacterium]
MKTAILVPCYNEEISIPKVVADCKKYLPKADVYVYDNNSKDNTIKVAKKAGAIVRRETHQGKGNVVRRMFADIEADVYVMIDGDATYDIKSIPLMIKKLTDENLDMVTGVRKSVHTEAYPSGHQFGNWMLTKIVHLFFGKRTQDMLSGLRVFSRRFAKSFPSNSKGFEIETELTVYASSMRLPVADVDTPYYARPAGSVSKLSTYKDGWRILKMIAVLIKEERPLFFFGLGAFFLFLFSVLCAIPVFWEYAHTGLVLKIPTAILSVGLMVCSIVSLAIALILDTVSNNRKENRRMQYLRHKSPLG